MHNADVYDVSYFAQTNFRNQKQTFGIKQADRMFHFYCLGKSGSGKTSLLKTLMLEDVVANRAFTFLDVHGDASREMVTKIKDHYPNRKLIYFDVTNPNLAIGYNPLKKVSPSKRSLVASNILEIFQRNWKAAWGMKMEHILRMILLSLLDQPKATLADILKILHDSQYRKQCLAHIQNEELKTFWIKEFPKYKSVDVLPIMNKLGAFLSHRIIQKIVVENKEQISLRSIIDVKIDWK